VPAEHDIRERLGAQHVEHVEDVRFEIGFRRGEADALANAGQ
jgi:hypothetical protein